MYYNDVIKKSSNKIRATWKIINKEKGKTQDNVKAPQIIHQNKLITNQKTIANLFNNYFLSITDLSNSEKNQRCKTLYMQFHGVFK